MKLEQVQELLPRSVRDMSQRLGLSATLVVVEKLGGISWRVAEGRGGEGEARRAALAELVGSDIEEQLHHHYAGEELYLAKCDAALRRLRDLQIHRRFEAGVRQGRGARDLVAELAREYKLSDRWVWEILGRFLPEPAQGTLFH